MARKVPQKFVPTEAQLLKSRERIAGYIVELGQPLNKAAAKLGHTERDLRKFLYNEPQQVITYFNRNSTFRRLFRQSGNIVTQREEIKSGRDRGLLVEKKRFKFTGPINGVNPLGRDEGTEEQQRQFKRFTQSIKLGYELPRLQMSLGWQKYTDQRGLPTGIEDIKEMYADGELSKRQVNSILTHWHSIYSDMSDDWYDDMVDQFAEYDELRDE